MLSALRYNFKMSVDPRVRFSLERTLLSWIRTSIALMGFGFLIARLSHPLNGSSNDSDLSLWIGVALILVGIYVNFTANHAFNKNIKKLEKGEAIDEGHWTLGKILSVLISVLSLLMVIHLIFNY